MGVVSADETCRPLNMSTPFFARLLRTPQRCTVDCCRVRRADQMLCIRAIESQSTSYTVSDRLMVIEHFLSGDCTGAETLIARSDLIQRFTYLRLLS